MGRVTGKTTKQVHFKKSWKRIMNIVACKEVGQVISFVCFFGFIL